MCLVFLYRIINLCVVTMPHTLPAHTPTQIALCLYGKFVLYFTQWINVYAARTMIGSDDEKTK